MLAKELFITLTAPAATSVPISKVRSHTTTSIHQAGNDLAKLELIEDVLKIMVVNTEISNEILCEVWAMVTEEGLWKAKFSSEDEEMTVLDDAQLQDLRKRAQANRGRKNRYRKSIQRCWGSEVNNWTFADMGETHLSFAA